MNLRLSFSFLSLSIACLLIALYMVRTAAAPYISEESEPTLLTTGNGARYVVIVPNLSQLDPADTATLAADPSIKQVDLKTIYADFSDGDASADAIRAFIEYAHASWDPAPEMVLLVGDQADIPVPMQGDAWYQAGRNLIVERLNVDSDTDLLTLMSPILNR